MLIGGGHAHVQVLKALARDPLSGLRITVVSAAFQTPYSGMLPGHVAGHYERQHMHIDLAPLSARLGACLMQAEVNGLDCAQGRVQLANRPPLRYDLLSINCGSAPNTSLIRGARVNGIPVKPIGGFLVHLDALLARVRSAGEAHLTIVGAGAGGFELAMALRYRLAAMALRSVVVELVYASPRVMVGRGVLAARLAEREARRQGLVLVPDFEVVEAKSGSLLSASGVQRKHGDLIWATQAMAQPWLRGSGLSLDADGFVEVDARLVNPAFDNVFAAGDVASMTAIQLPKAGVYAVRQGPVLAANIVRRLTGRPLRHYRPQRNHLALISLGKQRAMACRGRLCLPPGKLFWRYKNHLDLRFLKRFLVPAGRSAGRGGRVRVTDPDPQDQAYEDDHMLCGGCAAKIDQQTLDDVLRRSNLLAQDAYGPGGDAALIEAPGDLAQVQSIDGFRAFFPDPWLVGGVAAEHALNDVYAVGGAPHTALVWVTVARARPALMRDELIQTLAGVQAVLRPTNVRLAGGHSGIGLESSVGLAVTGTVGAQPWSKAALRQGDALLLTKPIGAGVLLAAYAQGLCRGDWLRTLLETLCLSNAPAVPLLHRFGVRACTDVTGFGLLGHGAEMARASGLTVVIDVHAVPVLDGALECLHLGVASSLQAGNERILTTVAFDSCSAGQPRIRLLVDPMTSGGLLFGIPANQAGDCLEALRDLGLPAARIGEVLAAGDKPLLVRACSTSW